MEKALDMIQDDEQQKYKTFKSRFFNNLSKTCYTKCIESFIFRSVSFPEGECMDNCISKLLKSYERTAVIVENHYKMNK